MTRNVQLVRLLTSVVIAFAACSFVVFYDRALTIRYPFDHPNAEGSRTASGEFVISHRPAASEFITAYRTYAYAVPLAALLLGILVIWRWPKLPALVEVVVSAMWVLGLVWAAFVLLMWQAQNIPSFDAMRSHY